MERMKRVVFYDLGFSSLITLFCVVSWHLPYEYQDRVSWLMGFLGKIYDVSYLVDAVVCQNPHSPSEALMILFVFLQTFLMAFPLVWLVLKFWKKKAT